MGDNDSRTTLLQIPLVRERYGMSAAATLLLHGAAAALLLFGGRFMPSPVIQLGSGQGGGFGGEDIATVGVVDQFSGGAGMVKPSLVPQPPALEEAPPRPEADSSIALPGTVEPPRKPEPKRDAAPRPPGNAIPTEARPGSGGVAGMRSGGGGGVGGGNGISVGAGSGGFGDSAYAAALERRISDNWQRPPAGVRMDVTYSFYIGANGVIYGIQKEESSGNPILDLTAERAIKLVKGLPAMPMEFRGKKVQFVARFVYPPEP
ncbi:MAG: TonB family protein [Acidobacteriota bacterium]|jgi:TonB family protein|nr:TonB family protein [Acidobacteriota bacterium]